MKPLAEIMRPKTLEDFVDQKDMLAKGKPLYNLITNKVIPNCTLYEPPGTGKITLVNIMANYVDRRFYELNATTASIKDIQKITESLDSLLNYNRVVIYIDELQHFSKKQQQALLKFAENGRVTLVASTIKNPYFAVHKAILSRCNIFKSEALNINDITIGLEKAIGKLINEGIHVEYSLEALKYIGEISQGNCRKTYNILELTINPQLKYIEEVSAKYIESLNQSHMRANASGDEYHNLLSVLQKSIRGSDPDVAMHYLARLIKSGNLATIIRRISVVVAEDMGLSHPNALGVVNSGIESALKVGFPEAQIILAGLIIYLTTLPKSNSAYSAITSAMKDLENRNIRNAPSHLKDVHYTGAKNLGVSGYRYPHDYENNYVKQLYMPGEVKNSKYYFPQKDKCEGSINIY